MDDEGETNWILVDRPDSRPAGQVDKRLPYHSLPTLSRRLSLHSNLSTSLPYHLSRIVLFHEGVGAVRRCSINEDVCATSKDSTLCGETIGN